MQSCHLEKCVERVQSASRKADSLPCAIAYCTNNLRLLPLTDVYTYAVAAQRSGYSSRICLHKSLTALVHHGKKTRDGNHNWNTAYQIRSRNAHKFTYCNAKIVWAVIPIFTLLAFSVLLEQLLLPHVAYLYSQCCSPQIRVNLLLQCSAFVR